MPNSHAGSPALPDQPYAARGATPAAPGATQPPHVDMAEALQRLQAHLKDHPDDLDAWLLLARTELDRSQFKEAVDAYRHAVELAPDWVEAHVNLGTALFHLGDAAGARRCPSG